METGTHNHPLRRITRVVSLPVRLIGHGLQKIIPHNRKQGEVVIGTIIMFTGAGIASLHFAHIPHFIVDGVGYTIHAIGAAPIIERVLIVVSAGE